MSRQILVIDDSAPIHTLVAALLVDEGVEIHSANDGAYGITLAKSLHPDMILLDVEMPGLNGFETCKRLRADPAMADVPIIFLTGVSALEEKVRGLELGATDYVTKPFNSKELQARVRASLRTSHLIRLLEQKALIDPLSGLGNLAMFQRRHNAEVSLRVRTHHPLSCIMFGVDQFKRINDQFGRHFGDQVLHKMGQIVTTLVRNEDVPCRHEQDQFAILTPNTTAAQAAALAERMRIAIGKVEFAQQSVRIKVSCSFGIAEAWDLYDRSILQRADQAMYESKQKGRNRVTVAPWPQPKKVVAAA
jgi:diguanylate cyclase (GGDEF)-like protein